MEKYIISFFVAAVISMFMTPISKKIAIKVGAIDIPKDERRIHKKPILFGRVGYLYSNHDFNFNFFAYE